MDPETGRLARLHMEEEMRAGSAIDPREALEKELAADEESKEAILEMLERADKEGRDPPPLVAVDEPVVQRLRLGDKELRRRRQRRR